MKKILFLFIFIFFLFTGIQTIKAATVDMTGYAWGADLTSSKIGRAHV